MPIHKVLLWTGFGLAVRLWQLGIEMRPLFTRQAFWVYPVYGSIGGAFGYWLQGVERRQIAYLSEKRDALHAMRKRRGEREAGLSVTPEEGRQEKLEGRTTEQKGLLNQGGGT